MRNATRINDHVTIGTVPNGEDLEQLAALGYRTLVDVRTDEEKFAGFVASRAETLGLDYQSVAIDRAEIALEDVIGFYRLVYDPNRAPVYAFSRFGKKPAAFLVLLEAVAHGEPLPAVFQRASRLGFDLRGDLCLQSFLVDLFNERRLAPLEAIITELRPDLSSVPASSTHRRRTGRPDPGANVSWEAGLVTREERWRKLGRSGATLWLTGLSGAGKTTIACQLEATLTDRQVPAYRLDGDNVRHGLCADLRFSATDREENIRRIGEVAKLLGDAGTIAIVAFISPYRADRDRAREIHESAGLRFFEVHVDAPLEVCEARDPKGLYRKARAGELPGFTGIDDPYEPPTRPDLVLNTARESVSECVVRCLQLLDGAGCLAKVA